MKLLIILSAIACSYAAKLDRTYLPPASAGSSGGSPGSLTAPLESGRPGFSGLSQSSSPSGSSQPSGPSSFDLPSGTGFNQIPFAKSGPTFGQQSAQASPAYRPGQSQPSDAAVNNIAPGFQVPSTQYGEPSTGFAQSKATGANFGQSPLSQSALGGGQAPSLFGQTQDANAYSAQGYQPERARASLDRNAEILRYDNQNDGETFAYSFETSNGITAEESGIATNGVQAQGGFSYTDDDGQLFRVTYTADENGYQPQGDHLPTPPPIPEEILRSIEENARAAAAGIQEGAYNPDEDESGFSSQQYSSGSASYYQGKESSSLQTGAYNQPRGQAQGPQQSSAPSTSSTFNQAPPSAGSSNFQGLNKPNQYTSGFSQVGQNSQLSQSGYDYNEPQSSASFGRQSSPFNQIPATQYTPAIPKSQTNGAQQTYPTGPVSAPASSSNNQGSILPGFSGQRKEAARPTQPQGPSSYLSGVTQGLSPAQSSSYQGAVESSAVGQPQGPSFSNSATQGFTHASATSNVGVASPSAFGKLQRPSSPSGTYQAYSPASGTNNQAISGSSSFGEPQRSQSFPSGTSQVFGSASGLNNKAAPESSAQGNGRYQPPQPSRSSMPQSAPYEYSRPGQQSGAAQPGFSSGSQQPETKSSPFNQGRPGQTFGAARQPPSFSAEEGYKY